MTLRRWSEATWTELRDLDRGRAVALLPVGAVEAHGPHLPLATDLIIAGAMAEMAAPRLEEEGWLPILLPALAYTAAPFGEAFPGTLSVRPATVTALVEDVGRALAGTGVRGLGIANAHLDPAHLAALHSAVGRLRADTALAVAFPDLTRRPWALRLGEEFVTGACHAGRYETSVVMAVQPELVREARRTALAANPASLSEAIRAGKRSFVEAGGPEAYFGWPAEATAEEGWATLATLGGILAEALLDALAGPAAGSKAPRPV
jgi:creatinine amidohydrolase